MHLPDCAIVSVVFVCFIPGAAYAAETTSLAIGTASDSTDIFDTVYSMKRMYVNFEEEDYYYDDDGEGYIFSGDSTPILYGDRSFKVTIIGQGDYDDGDYYESYLDDVAVTAVIKGKKHTKRTNSLGTVKFNLPIQKCGTKIKLYAKYGSKKLKKTVKVRPVSWGYDMERDYSDEYDYDSREKCNDNINFSGNTYKNSKMTEIEVYGATKGDYVVTRIGKKTFKSKIKKSKYRTVLKIKHKTFPAGTKIRATHYNKFNQKMGGGFSHSVRGRQVQEGLD